MPNLPQVVCRNRFGIINIPLKESKRMATVTQDTLGTIELLTAGPITEEQQHGIEYIMAYDFAMVREKILNEGTLRESIVDEAIVEFRKWLLLIQLGYGPVAMCSKEVDEVWHTFILFTRSYMSFCEQAFGWYLHHEPATNAVPVPGDAKQTFYAAYREVFGALHPLWGKEQLKKREDDEPEPGDERDPHEPGHSQPDDKPDPHKPDDEPGDCHSGGGCYTDPRCKPGRD
jgi:hypothetical protein